jgi:hypothetical protein
MILLTAVSSRGDDHSDVLLYESKLLEFLFAHLAKARESVSGAGRDQERRPFAIG